MNILGLVNSKLEAANVPYEYGEWSSTVTYPYFVGSYAETEYRYEDECTIGQFTIDGWARGSSNKIELFNNREIIKNLFSDLQEIYDDTLYFIRYGGCQEIPTGEKELSRIQITLYTNFWKGIEE